MFMPDDPVPPNRDVVVVVEQVAVPEAEPPAELKRTLLVVMDMGSCLGAGCFHFWVLSVPLALVSLMEVGSPLPLVGWGLSYIWRNASGGVQQVRAAEKESVFSPASKGPQGTTCVNDRSFRALFCRRGY